MAWLGNIYQKFENMIVEVESTMFEETVQYLENQIQIVGESVRNFYSDVMEDLIPRESSINCDSDNSIKETSFISHAKQHVGIADILSNIDSDENQQNRKMPASETATEVTFGSSQSCEISNANQNHEATISKTGSTEVTTFTFVGDCCNEIEKASTEQNHDVSVSVKAMQPEDSNVIADTDVTIEQDHKTTRQDNASKLEETCVMITKDELPLVSNATVNIKTSKKIWLQHFSLSKKSTRKQEYEELALKHRNNENGKGDRVESLCQTLPEDVSEPDWEFLEIPR